MASGNTCNKKGKCRKDKTEEEVEVKVKSPFLVLKMEERVLGV
jgi:hypothetical protein